MLKSIIVAASVALLGTAALSATANATEDSKKATVMLFQTPHIADVKAGTKFVYTNVRAPSDEAALGKGFTDNITVDVESDGAPGKKNVLLHVYSGERARDPQRITDMDGNPMLVIFLDNALGRFQQLAGGDRGYLKDKMRRGIGDQATLSPVKIAFQGAEVDGFRVLVKPFENDPARARMRGFENTELSFIVSDKIPGHLAKMVANFSNTQKDAATMVDTMTLDGVGEVK